MRYGPMKITFTLDGTGVYYDILEPTHLDALLSWAAFSEMGKIEPPATNERPMQANLPLKRWRVGRNWGWCASAIFPVVGKDGMMTIQYWRKKFRHKRIRYCKGVVNLQSSIYREYNTPTPLLLCCTMEAYANGDLAEVKRLLTDNVRYIGHKRAHGKGRITGVDVTPCWQDLSIIANGKAQRIMPLAGAPRTVRTKPPYWSNYGKIECCEIGQDYNFPTQKQEK